MLRNSCFASLFFAYPLTLAAQCTPQWLPGEGLSGVIGAGERIVRATTMWDPDGAGPLSPRLVVGGNFATAGSVDAGNIACRDVATGSWSALGSLDRPVNALAVLPNGDLVAGGQFTIGGLPANGIGRWNGSAWLPLGSGILGSVNALAVLPNGDLVAGGDLWSAGGVATNSIARWDGSTWSTLGGGISGSVDALAVLPNGDLVAGGQFFAAGGVVMSNIARWDGSTWSALGSGMNGGVAAFAVLPNGDLVAGGYFGAAGGVVANGIARWDGSTWSPLGSGVNGTVAALAVLPNGELVAGGFIGAAGGVLVNGIARWDGSTWSSLGIGIQGVVNTLVVLPNGDLVAGGEFWSAGGVGADNIARWNGSAWSVLGIEVNSSITAFATLPNGDLIAGGYFTAAGGVNARRIARWNGSAWFELGSGLGIAGVSPTQGVLALAVLPNGDVVAGGDFEVAGGVAVNGIARWNGSTWLPLGSGMTAGILRAYINALAVLPNGDLVAAGLFVTAGGLPANGIARWNGSTWSTLGSGIGGTAFVSVSALAVLPNGDLVAGGSFTSAGGVSANRIARWDGSTWSTLGSGMNDVVSALVVLPNGDLVAGGGFTTAGGVSANRIARWDGTNWSVLGSGMHAASFVRVWSFAVLPNGDLVAGGAFTIAGGTAANGIARWDGSAWSALGLGLGGGATALAMLPSGQLAAGGGFLTAGGQPSACFARYATPCPAVATTTGAACASSGGSNTLAAVTLPWVDATYRTRGTGLPSLAIVAVVNGLSTVAIPLAAVLPPSPAGCSLLVVPDLVDAVLTTTGTVDAQLALPNTPSLAGTLLHQQFVVLQLDASGSFVQVTSTNRLTATIGSF